MKETKNLDELYEIFLEKKDEKAKWDIILASKPLINSLISKKIPLVKKEMREDLMSEMSLRLYKMIDSYDPNYGAKFSTYIFRCCDWVFLASFKPLVEIIKLGKGKDDPRFDFTQLHPNIPDPKSGESQIIFEVGLEEFIKSLTEKEREILRYRHKGYSQNEIGSKVGMSQGGVSRALKEISEKFYE